MVLAVVLGFGMFGQWKANALACGLSILYIYIHIHRERERCVLLTTSGSSFRFSFPFVTHGLVSRALDEGAFTELAVLH